MKKNEWKSIMNPISIMSLSGVIYLWDGDQLRKKTKDI